MGWFIFASGWSRSVKPRINRWVSLAGLTVAVGASVAHGVVVETGTIGRFITITNNGAASRLLHVNEIEAFVAGGTVVSSSLEPGYDKALTSQGASFESQVGPTAHGSNTAPLDGIQNTGSATFTINSAVGAKMVYDLGTTRDLSTLKLWQRADGCCQERLSNFTVSVQADNAGLPGATVFTQSFPLQVTTNSAATFDLLTGRDVLVGGAGVVGTEVLGENAARFIRVRNNLDAGRLLHIGEIEAFATGVTPNNATDLSTNEITGDNFESSRGPIAHGLATALTNDVRDISGNTFTLNTAAGNEMVIDLNTSTDLGAVRLWQRNDGCCQERLSNFTVSLLKDNGSGLPGDEVFAFNHTTQVATNSFAQINVPTITDAFTLKATDELVLDVDLANGIADLLKIGSLGTGALTITPGASLVINVLSSASGPQTFDVLDFGSVTGSFSSITINGPSRFDLSQLLVTGQITSIVPEPMTAMLGLMGLAGLAARTGRRNRA